MFLRQNYRRLIIHHVSVIRNVVRVVYVRQRAILMAVAEVCYRPTGRGTRTEHSYSSTTTAAAAAVPIICWTSQGLG